MKISKAVKIIIGILTAWVVISPVVYLVLWFAFLFPTFTTEVRVQPSFNDFPRVFFPIFILIFCTAWLQFGLQAFYMVHVILNKAGGDLLRAIFGVGFFILAIIALPVYYFIYILPDNPPHWALAPNPPSSVNPPGTPPLASIP